MKGVRSRRGLLIVLEGCDRTGKTTHCQRLVQELNQDSSAKAMRFPDRTTYIGKIIDDYLKGQAQVEDHAIHLLFSSNRWEKVAEMNASLAAGTHVVVDRYAFSGVAFSAAKDGLSIEWCKQADRGLPKPDLVCFLDVSPDVANQRGGFGEERYEQVAFQIKVRENYNRLMDSSWKHVDTDEKSLEAVYEEVSKIVKDTIAKNVETMPLDKLWPKNEENKM